MEWQELGEQIDVIVDSEGEELSVVGRCLLRKNGVRHDKEESGPIGVTFLRRWTLAFCVQEGMGQRIV